MREEMVLHANDGRSSRIIYDGEEQMSAEKHATQFMCNSRNKQNAIRFHIAQCFFQQFVLAHHRRGDAVCHTDLHLAREKKWKNKIKHLDIIPVWSELKLKCA